MSDLCLEPAHRLCDLLRQRKVSAVTLLDHYAARIERLNPALNAVVALDLDGARARAAEADAALARGQSWGALHGLPMTIKDSIEVAGMPTTSGAAALKDYRPRRHAPAVQRLVDAGAIVFGKTNVPLYTGDIQTYNALHGTTRNPWNLERTPGGSSGGAAAAVAAGLTGLELGSDLAGSIRTPAHFCGIYGHKPTHGIVPHRGHVPPPPGTLGEPDLSVVGPLGRSAEDLALALGIVAGPLAPESDGWRLALPPPRRAALAEYRVHAWLDDPACPVESGVRTVLEAAVDGLRRAGCAVTIGAPPGIALAETYELYFDLLAALMAGGLPPKVYRRARMFGALSAWLGRDRSNTLGGFSRGATLSHRQWLRLNEQRQRLRARFQALFQDVDVLLMPVTRTAAPAHLQQGTPYARTLPVDGQPQAYTSQFNWIGPATMALLPATSAPVGRSAEGLPVGLQIVGGHLQDLTTIDFARQLAGVIGGYVPPP